MIFLELELCDCFMDPIAGRSTAPVFAGGENM
jgi:hypothetical protein